MTNKKRVCAYVDKETSEMIDYICKKEYRSESMLLNYLLKEYINEKYNDIKKGEYKTPLENII